MTITETQDIDRIQALATQCYMDAYREIHTEEQNRFSFNEMYSTASLQSQLTDKRSRFFVLQDDGIDQGYIAIYPLAPDHWMVDKLYLLPSSKGKGYGRILAEYAENMVRNIVNGPFCLSLKVNRRNAAVEFYKHLGYEITGLWDIAIADGQWIMDGYDMEKQFE